MKNQKKLLTKLCISRHDLMQAKWFALFLEENDLYRCGNISTNRSACDLVAYTTALIIAYGRIFKESQKLPLLPEEEFIMAFSQEERNLHKELIRLRDKCHAHSDKVSYAVEKSDSGYSTNTKFFLYLDKEQLRVFKNLTDKLNQIIRNKIESLNIPKDFLYPSP